jgi:hypothetical protein
VIFFLLYFFHFFKVIQSFLCISHPDQNGMKSTVESREVMVTIINSVTHQKNILYFYVPLKVDSLDYNPFYQISLTISLLLGLCLVNLTKIPPTHVKFQLSSLNHALTLDCPYIYIYIYIYISLFQMVYLK